MSQLSPEQINEFRKQLQKDDIFCEKLLKIYDKKVKLLPLSLNPEQKLVLEAMGKFKTIWVIKARQRGISTGVQAKIFKEAVTKPTRAFSLTHRDDSTQVFRRMQDTFYTNLPDGLRPKRGLSNNTITTYPEMDSTVSIGTAGGQGEVGRGYGGISYVHASEVAFWANPEKLMAGLFQASPQCVVVESTANGAQGYFYENINRMMNSGWKTETEIMFFFPWYTAPEYSTPLQFVDELRAEPEEQELMRIYNLTLEQIKWRRQKIVELGKNLFMQEYPSTVSEAFLKSDKGYFDDVRHAFKIPLNSVTYDPSHQYVAGLDWGQAQDFTVLSIIDISTSPPQQVDMLRVNKMAWSEIRRKVIQKLKYWNVTQVLAEENSMSANMEMVRTEIQEAGLKTALVGFDTNNASKLRIMSTLNDAMSLGQIILLMDEFQMSEIAAYTAKQTSLGAWTLQSPKGQNDDTVIALALAYWCSLNNYRLVVGHAPKILSGRR